MNRNNRLLAYILIFSGLLIIGEWLNFTTIAALVMVYTGIRQVRATALRIGYTLLGIGITILLLEHLQLFFTMILISLFVFYIRARKELKNKFIHKRLNITSRLKWDQKPFILHHHSMRHLISESYLDLSLAILEEPETTLVFQGVLGSMDVIVSDDIGVYMEVTILFGQIDVDHNKETGLFNKWTWKSANYEFTEQRVKLHISYIVGSIDIRSHM